MAASSIQQSLNECERKLRSVIDDLNGYRKMLFKIDKVLRSDSEEEEQKPTAKAPKRITSSESDEEYPKHPLIEESSEEESSSDRTATAIEVLESDTSEEEEDYEWKHDKAHEFVKLLKTKDDEFLNAFIEAYDAFLESAESASVHFGSKIGLVPDMSEPLKKYKDTKEQLFKDFDEAIAEYSLFEEYAADVPNNAIYFEGKENMNRFAIKIAELFTMEAN